MASYVASSVGTWLNKAKDSAMSVKDQASQRILTDEIKGKISSGLNQVNSSGLVQQMKQEFTTKSSQMTQYMQNL